MTEERYAIDYGDGSFGILTAEHTIETAFGEVDFYNKGEDPADRAKLVRVRIDRLNEVERPGALGAASPPCPCCKRPLP